MSCVTRFDECDGVTASGCEADLAADPMNCGGCSVVCAGCTDGSCPPGTVTAIDAASGGPSDFSATPVALSLANAADVCLGDGHGCAVSTMGLMACWGTNGRGQLGLGTTSSGEPETIVTTITDALAIACGEDRTCVLRRGGVVSCWGDNTNGQVGDGTTTDRSSPVDVTFP